MWMLPQRCPGLYALEMKTDPGPGHAPNYAATIQTV